MVASNDAERAAGPEKRLAENGHPYTRKEFLTYYKSAGELRWAEAEARGPPADGNAAQLPAVPLPEHDSAPSSGIQAPDVGLSNNLIESFVGSEDRAASQVPIAPSNTDLGMAQMGAFDAQAQLLAQSQQDNKEIESATTHPAHGPPAD